jgi:hypothetical protein
MTVVAGYVSSRPLASFTTKVLGLLTGSTIRDPAGSVSPGDGVVAAAVGPAWAAVFWAAVWNEPAGSGLTSLTTGMPFASKPFAANWLAMFGAGEAGTAFEGPRSARLRLSAGCPLWDGRKLPLGTPSSDANWTRLPGVASGAAWDAMAVPVSGTRFGADAGRGTGGDPCWLRFWIRPWYTGFASKRFWSAGGKAG